ncbi:BA14K family protein [Roseibium sp. RKSG952]|nr:BA14K family protein [Roseibium sp. RKSG952]
MFRKTFLKGFALASFSAMLASAGVSAAHAGGYGYGSGYGSGYGKQYGYQTSAPQRPFANVKDHVWKNHVSWCADRFSTYNSHDNTYQPYSGPRQQCWSPYIRY